MGDYTVYIDEAGDLGIGKGTRWFVLSAVLVHKPSEPQIRLKMEQIRNRLNVKEIHLRKIQDFYKRGLIVRELNQMDFVYMNILVDTNKFDVSKIPNSIIAYNYVCKYLLQRVSWFLEVQNAVADIVCPPAVHLEMESLLRTSKKNSYHILGMGLILPRSIKYLPKLRQHGTCCNWPTYAQQPCF